MTDRRSFLRKVAATGVAAAGGVLVLPAPRRSPTTVEGPDEDWTRGVAEAADDVLPRDEPVDDEDASPVARYQYVRVADDFVPTSPINVVVPLGELEARTAPDRDLGAVMDVLEGAGWIRRPEEYVRYARDRSRERYVVQEATAAQTYYGTSGRVHVRCWEFDGVVSMQAHEDGKARPKHGVASYERGRSAVESLFAAAGWTVASTALDLANEGPPDHDGAATVIRPAGVTEA